MTFSRQTAALMFAGAGLLFVVTMLVTRALTQDEIVESEVVLITATRPPVTPATATTTASPTATAFIETATPTVLPVTATFIPSATTDLLTTSTPLPFPTATPFVTATQGILPSATPVILGQVQITSEVGGWLRGGPGTDYPIVGEVLAGSIYGVLAYQNRDGGLWYLIVLENGQTVWVSGDLATLTNGTTFEEIAQAATLPPTPLPTATVTVTPTRTPPTRADAYVSYGRDNLRLRSAPDDQANVLTLLPELESLTLRGRTPDEIWYNVFTTEGREGWVMAEFVTVNRSLETVPIVEFIPTATSPAVVSVAASGSACIAVVGDSMPYGDIVYKIPELGFMTVQMKPFSLILAEQVQSSGRNYSVIDRTVPAAMLSASSPKPYMQTESYRQLLQDRCAFTVITPWLNDLNLSRSDNATVHVAELVSFLQILRQANPEGQILLLGFYFGQPASFTPVYAGGYTADNVNGFNQRIFEACATGGAIAALGNITCLPVQDSLWAGGAGVFAGSMGRDTFYAGLHGAVPPESQPLLDDFWNKQPEGVIIGDGIHLSEQGKTLLAQLILAQFIAVFAP